MKRIAAIALFVAATLVTTGTALAQDHGVKANVPFNFSVAGTWLPAGTYIIGSSALRSNVIQIGSREKGNTALALAWSMTTILPRVGNWCSTGSAHLTSSVKFAMRTLRPRLPACHEGREEGTAARHGIQRGQPSHQRQRPDRDELTHRPVTSRPRGRLPLDLLSCVTE